MSTFAGTGFPGYSGDGGPATAAQLYCALGLVFGPDHALYVDDHVNNRIRRIDAAGTITTVVGSGPAGLDLGSWSGDGGPATSATLQEPVEIVFDAAGALYISDRDNNRIRKVDTQGVITTIAGNGNTGFEGDGVPGNKTSVEFPLGIAIDPKGNVVFADEGNKRIRTIDHLTGIITTIAGNGVNATTGDGGPATAASVGDPGAIIFDAAGNLYLAGTGAPGYRRIDTHGRISSGTAIGSITVPQDFFAMMDGETFDSAGNFYTATGQGVFRIDTSGKVTLLAGQR
ncbi:MAG: hypothetical protein HY264_03665 [Chloroflexi bacterium]|nr:hypothetical protein [Chloroflexota bacterium]